MFLNPATLEQDDVFAGNGSGNYLDGSQRLSGHAEALRSAFNLTGDEYGQIITALHYDDNTDLTIPNISAIFRRGWLARKLKLSVRELLLLTDLTGLDPFALPDPTQPAILRLISLVQALRDRSLKSAVALYLIWNQDLSGKSAPDPAQMEELGRTLRGDFAAIEDHFRTIEDPNGDVALARMTLVYGQEASDAFFTLLDDTLVVDVSCADPGETLEAAIKIDKKLAYDHFRHRLSHTGLLTDLYGPLKGIPNLPQDFSDAIDDLFHRGQQIKGRFFTRYPELENAYSIAVVKPPADRHSAFLAEFQPDLARKRKRQQALQRLSAAAWVDLPFTQTILDPSAPPYPLRAAGPQNGPALDDVVALDTAGLAAEFFFRDTATEPIDESRETEANLAVYRSWPAHHTTSNSASHRSTPTASDWITSEPARTASIPASPAASRPSWSSRFPTTLRGGPTQRKSSAASASKASKSHSYITARPAYTTPGFPPPTKPCHRCERRRACP
jgi:hypothetical protein